MNNDSATATFIIDTVAPIFNRKGYVGTSLSDLTAATGLTKGAIYCNFRNKEDLALRAFYRNVELVIGPMGEHIRNGSDVREKLLAIVDFYRDYYPRAASQGGCPVLNVGIDAKHVNPELYNAAREVVGKLIADLVRIVDNGKRFGQVKEQWHSAAFAHRFYAVVEGGIYLTFLQDEEHYLHHALDAAAEMVTALCKT